MNKHHWTFALMLGIALGATVLGARTVLGGESGSPQVTWEYTALCAANFDEHVNVCRALFGEERTVDCRNIMPTDPPEDLAKKYRPQWRQAQFTLCPLEVVNRMGAQGWEYVGQNGIPEYNYEKPLPSMDGAEDRPLVFRRAM